MMKPRERILCVLRGEIPDCVPCSPDISNMVPCRLTGKPFWDIYAYQDPPLWKAHIDALKYFDLDGGFELILDPFAEPNPFWEARIVYRYPDGRFVVQFYHRDREEWSKEVTVFTADNPPATGVKPENIGLPPCPKEWEPLTGVQSWPKGMDLWRLVRREMGDQGILGMHSGMTTCVLRNPEDVYAYYEDPSPFFERVEKMKAEVDRRLKLIQQLTPEDRPDILFCGGSGTLIWQNPEIVRKLVLPLLKYTTERAMELGIPTHVHSCGPEQALVEMAATETCLTVIDPLEIPPMGDCLLGELKKRFADKIVLKGNLHTTEVMLRGTVEDVRRACKQCIDEAAQGGRFILSTGDQCGRDTPDANLFAMVEVARSYGKY